MLPRAYLDHGLTGLARCHERPWDSHFPAAVLAGYYFAAGRELGAETEAALATQLDQLIAGHAGLFRPYPAGGRAADRTGPVTAALEASIGRFSELGHDAIFGAYMLRALHDRPEFAHDTAIADLGRNVGAFGTGRARYWLHLDRRQGHDPRTFELPERTLLPDSITDRDLASLIFTELTRFRHIYTQMGSKSHIGHLLTQSHALITLRRLGRTGLANRGLYSLECRLTLLRDSQDYRAGPHSFYRPATRSALLPTEAAYWRQDFTRCEWDEGHVCKYTLAFHELAELVDDAGLRDAAREKYRYLITPDERSKSR